MFEWYEKEVQDLAKKALSDTPPTGSVVFYGSSSIRLWSTLVTDIAPMTDWERRVINLGFGGSTLEACVHYFDQLPGRVAREGGELRSLVVYAGENDLGDGKSAEAVVDSFVWLHALVRDKLGDTPFAFMSIKPSPGRAPVMDKIRAVNERVQELIPSRAESHYIDVYSAMLNDKGEPRRELWTDDGVHMNAAGYAVWTQILSGYAETLFR